MCSENPFVAMFGSQGSAQADDNKDKAKKKKKTAQKRPNSLRVEANFRPRSAEEIEAVIKEWQLYVHPRAQDFFRTQELMTEVLTQLAKGIDKNDDPVLGPEEKCVFWYGDVTKDDNQAAIRMVKPGESEESVTYVNRVLAFIFATDDSFDQLMQLPKEPFKMGCNDQLCVHLAHISLNVEPQTGAKSSAD